MQLPGELLTSLSRRIGLIRVCTNGYAAFAEVCAIQRDRRVYGGLSSALAKGEANGVVLVLVQPAQLAELLGVIDAIELYAPGTTLWCYDRSANPKLRGVVSGDVQKWSAAQAPDVGGEPRSSEDHEQGAQRVLTIPVIHTRPVPEVAPRPLAPSQDGVPQMRLVGTEDAPESAARRGALSEEELRMLLSDDPMDDPSGRGPGGRR